MTSLSLSLRSCLQSRSPCFFARFAFIHVQKLRDAREAPGRDSDRQPAKDTSSLWVDRYRPQRFTELLGDDRVHREVLSWIKEWDACVFGKGKSRGKKRARGDEDGESRDDYGRPREKVGRPLRYP